MRRKLMVVAIAAAFAAPGAVLAQGSSVQIYGSLSVSVEGAEASDADTSNAPAGGGSSVRGGNLGGGYATTNVNLPWRSRTQASGSNIGFRGREDLGNGLYMGFQAEVGTIAMGGVTPESPSGNGVKVAWRNSGVWLGGRWGEVGVGIWDLPFNTNQTLGAAHAAYANASTTMTAGLLGGGLMAPVAGASSSGQDIGQFCGASGSGRVGDDLLPECAQLPSPAEQLGVVSVADLGWIAWPRSVRRNRRRNRQCEQRRCAVPR